MCTNLSDLNWGSRCWGGWVDDRGGVGDRVTTSEHHERNCTENKILCFEHYERSWSEHKLGNWAGSPMGTSIRSEVRTDTMKRFEMEVIL